MNLSQLPKKLVDAVGQPAGAQAFVFGLLLPRDDALRTGEIDRMKEEVDEEVLAEVGRIYDDLGNLDSAQKLAIVDRGLSVLRRLTPEEYERFCGTTRWLIERNNEIDLFEFALQKVMKRNLESYFHRVSSTASEYRSLGVLREELSILLSTLAYLGHRDDRAAAEAAFAGALREVENQLDGGAVVIKEPADCTLTAIDAALDRFGRATSQVKRQLLQACGKSVMADEEIRDGEASLIRAISDAIGGSIPLFVRNKR